MTEGPHAPGGSPLDGAVPSHGGDAHPADSAGTPWAGRDLSVSAYADDHGAADPALVSALQGWADAPPKEWARAEMAALEAMRSARFLVPLVAAPGEAGAEMATAVLEGPEGERALPLFTGVATLAAWSPQARPVPMGAGEAARAALEDGCLAALVDLGSPHEVALRLSQLVALAEERPWLPAHEDPVVVDAVAAAVQGLDEVVRAAADDGRVHGPGVLRLVLELAPGCAPERVDALARHVGERLAGDPAVRSRIDDVAFVIHQATPPPELMVETG